MSAPPLQSHYVRSMFHKNDCTRRISECWDLCLFKGEQRWGPCQSLDTTLLSWASSHSWSIYTLVLFIFLPKATPLTVIFDAFTLSFLASLYLEAEAYVTNTHICFLITACLCLRPWTSTFGLCHENMWHQTDLEKALSSLFLTCHPCQWPWNTTNIDSRLQMKFNT